MKKLISIVIAILSLSVNSSIAKTQGNYAQVNILHTQSTSTDFYNKEHSDGDLGIGIEYKYALNFNNFFIAPALFYNHNNVELKYSNRDGDPSVHKLYSYGLKSDFGYDINDKISIFSTFGYSEVRFSLKTTFFSNNPTTIDAFSSTDEALIFGGGIKYSLNDKVDLQASYEYFNYVNEDIPNSLSPEVFKLGFAYNF